MSHANHMGDHMGDDMSGLVLGITVLPARGVATAGAERPSVANRLQLVAEKTPIPTVRSPRSAIRCGAAANRVVIRDVARPHHDGHARSADAGRRS